MQFKWSITNPHHAASSSSSSSLHGTKLVEYDFNSFLTKDEYLTVTVPGVQLNATYTLHMRDQGGDGICCNPVTGKGYIEIYAVKGTQQQLLANLWGNIQYHGRYQFTVPPVLFSKHGTSSSSSTTTSTGALTQGGPLPSGAAATTAGGNRVSMTPEN